MRLHSSILAESAFQFPLSCSRVCTLSARLGQLVHGVCSWKGEGAGRARSYSSSSFFSRIVSRLLLGECVFLSMAGDSPVIDFLRLFYAFSCASLCT